MNKEVRLRNAYVIKATHFDNDIEGNIATIYCTYDPDTLGKNQMMVGNKGVIHFVESSKAVPADFNIYDRLFLDPNPSQFDDMSSLINPNSLIIRVGM